MSAEVRLPSVSCLFNQEEKYFKVHITYSHGVVTVGTTLARHIATDLLIWADRVDKLNKEDCYE